MVVGVRPTAEPPTLTEIVDETAPLLVAGGIIVMALFPLALPLIALTALLVVPLVVVALAASLLAAPVVVVWRLARRRPGVSRSAAER
jgi:hypothetical protein